MEYNQHIMPEGEKLTLREFADKAITHLNTNTYGENEVVKLANDIVELEHDSMTRPDILLPLPDNFHYRFSGFFGQVIGIFKEG